MTTLENLPDRRIRDLERQLTKVTGERDAAREMFIVVEEQAEKALRLHVETDLGHCAECFGYVFPCATRRALTGADEDAA